MIGQKIVDSRVSSVYIITIKRHSCTKKHYIFQLCYVKSSIISLKLDLFALSMCANNNAAQLSLRCHADVAASRCVKPDGVRQTTHTPVHPILHKRSVGRKAQLWIHMSKNRRKKNREQTQRPHSTTEQRPGGCWETGCNVRMYVCVYAMKWAHKEGGQPPWRTKVPA